MSGAAQAQTAIFWEAFNDYAPTPGVTSDFATGYELRDAGSGGALKNIATGEDLAATVLVVLEGSVPDAFGANAQVNAGSPADILFNGKVDVGNDGLPGIHASNATKLTLSFSGLDPSKRYNFAGTVSRGGGYNDRWSVFTITGATAFVAAHEDGSLNKNIITKTTFPNADLEPNQVALNTGENKVGSLVRWNAIEPAQDGTFSIDAQQYVGPAPFGTPGNAPYGYGFSAIYLAEVEATGSLRITGNPASQRIPAGRTATLQVSATSTSPITYQWQKAAPASLTFAPVPGASQPTYVTPALSVADDGTKFRCAVSSGGNQATSTEATITVDGVLPTLVATRASINFDSIYLTFSEAMDLEALGDVSHYQINNLTISGSVVLSPTEVRLLTTTQTPGQKSTVTLNQVKDVAGNSVAANTSTEVTAFQVKTGLVGLEIWDSILGSLVSDLRADARYPDDPTRDDTTTSFDSTLVIPDGPLNTYGGRFRAWLTPDVSGDYEFFIRADDTAELWVGSDDNFDTIEDLGTPTASDAIVGDPFQEPGFDSSTSLPIPLLAGQRYAIQAIWKEGNGGDHCQVAWRLVGDPTPAADLQPIPSQFLSYYGPGTGGPGGITQISYVGGKVIIGWTGGVLHSSADLKTWSAVPGAVSPLAVTPGQATFYRVVP